ncbi:MAG: OmpA family protein [Myxococcota bacterium]|nr:OmpA family protein [Myxococcota bacterium]
MNGGDNTGIWLSIGDLMSGLMLFFALLFISVLAKLQEAQEQTLDTRTAVITALAEALEENDLSVEAAENGEIVFAEEMLFDAGSAALTPQGADLLARLAPVYADVILSNPEFDAEVARVILEGHTSSEGGELYNLDLSLRRASSVAAGMLAPSVVYQAPDHARRLKGKLYPAGRGPWDASESVVESDRRVVLRLQFQGDKFVTWVVN